MLWHAERAFVSRQFMMVLGLAAMFLISARVAEATFISIATEATVNIQGNTASIHVGVTNKGDEATYKVKISADIDGKIIAGHLRDILQANDKYTETLTASVGFKKPGTYPLIIHIEYADKNLYPFTALSFADAVYQEEAKGKVVGEPIVSSLTDRGTLRVKVKNIDQVEHKTAIRLVLPHEIATSASGKEVAVKPGSEETIIFDLKNISALPGSNYQIFATLSYEDEKYHYTSGIGGTIHIEEEKPILTRYKKPLIAVAVILSLIIVYMNVRRKGQEA